MLAQSDKHAILVCLGLDSILRAQIKSGHVGLA